MIDSHNTILLIGTFGLLAIIFSIYIFGNFDKAQKLHDHVSRTLSQVGVACLAISITLGIYDETRRERNKLDVENIKRKNLEIYSSFATYAYSIHESLVRCGDITESKAIFSFDDCDTTAKIAGNYSNFLPDYKFVFEETTSHFQLGGNIDKIRSFITDSDLWIRTSSEAIFSEYRRFIEIKTLNRSQKMKVKEISNKIIGIRESAKVISSISCAAINSLSADKWKDGKLYFKEFIRKIDKRISEIIEINIKMIDSDYEYIPITSLKMDDVVKVYRDTYPSNFQSDCTKIRGHLNSRLLKSTSEGGGT
jgi:hypothetical protein